MIAQREVTIVNSLGFHVRPATDFAEQASKFRSRIHVIQGNQEFDAKSSIDLLLMAAVQGTKLTIRAEGDDAREAVETLARMVEAGFGET